MLDPGHVIRLLCYHPDVVSVVCWAVDRCCTKSFLWNPLASPLEIDEELSSQGLPYTRFDSYNFYQEVLGKNCENVIGYVPIPVGFVGPLLLNGVEYNVPLVRFLLICSASTDQLYRV